MKHFTRYCQTHILSEEIILFSQVRLTSLTASRLAGSLCQWETRNQAPRSHDSIKADIYLKHDMCHLCNYLKFILWEQLTPKFLKTFRKHFFASFQGKLLPFRGRRAWPCLCWLFFGDGTERGTWRGASVLWAALFLGNRQFCLGQEKVTSSNGNL